jgi:hypothetical protein
MAVVVTLTGLAVLVLVAAAMAAPQRTHSAKHALACTSGNYVVTYLSGNQVAGDEVNNGCTVAAALENNSGLGWSLPFNGSGWHANVAQTSWYTMSCGYSIYYTAVGRTTLTDWERNPTGSVTC